MSQVKLTLRPPPNVDFVHGYPGIPPGGPDRPQAAVEGSIEVRVGPQGVKAKWVRIELRKVETLPGGGMSNTFYDYVGASPVSLWNSAEEFDMLSQSKDLPFSIRIPESIPPSIMLENKAGIQYELVASLCTKGKRSFFSSFFRKRKSVIVSTQASVIIDKHELHSTWPIYCQPETRQVTQDGCSLIVDRSQTCYGPGDHITVKTLFRSESASNTILRGFELTLRETTIFRTGPHSGKKSNAPLVKETNISDNKVMINSAVNVGTEVAAELACLLSSNHTTTSLNSARHIDITYILSVRALLDGRSPIIMDLPVIISNWQRVVSQEAIRRIGVAPTLSLTSQYNSVRSEAPHISPSPAVLSLTTKDPTSSPATNISALPPTNSYRAGPGPVATQVDDFAKIRNPVPTPTVPPTQSQAGRRPGSASASPVKLMVANAPPSESTIQEADTDSRQRTGSAPVPTPSSPALNNSSTRPKGPWLSAEEEKVKLYEKARARVERVQGGSDIRATTPPQGNIPPAPTQPAPARTGPYPTAEDEKLRLYNKARAAAERTHGPQSYSPPSVHGRSDSDGTQTANITRQTSLPKKQTPAAELYSQAMNARDAAMNRQKSANAALPQSQTSSPKAQPKPKVPQYLTAEQEKAALKRYHEAKMAVDRVQNAGYVPAESDAGSLQVAPNGPMPYDALYPDAKTNFASSSSPSVPPTNELPPPFGEMPANLIPQSALSEKERMRRAYAEQDAAAVRQNQTHQRTPSSDPPPFSQATSTPLVNGNQGLSEKEILRRHLDAQESLNVIAGRASPPQPPPPRTNSTGSRSPRPTPTPPTSPEKILTAHEEKALLKAKYAAQEARTLAKHQQQQQNQQTNGVGSSRPNSTLLPPVSTPPPLMPRPPVEYIQETQEEDARVSRLAMNESMPSHEDLQHINKSKPNGNTATLDVQPFSPFSPGFGSIPPPPLPPKPDGE